MDNNSPFALWRWLDTLSNFSNFLEGFSYTLSVAFLALCIAVVMGVFHALLATSKFMILKIWARIYVEFFFFFIFLINIFFFFFVLPMMPVVGVTLDVFTIGVIGIGVYHGAYMSEVVRAGILSIPKGQFEAARSQGFSYIQSMLYIILPQTLKIILPPSTNQAINLIKNTSALAIITGAELMYRVDSYAQSSLNYAPAYIIAGVLYFTVCYLLSFFVRRYEEKLKKVHLSR